MFRIEKISLYYLEWQQLIWGLGRLLEVSTSNKICTHTHTHTHTNTQYVWLLLTCDQLAVEANTCTKHYNDKKTKISAPSLIRTRDHSNQAAADLRLRLHDQWDHLCLTSQCISFYFFLTSEHGGFFSLPLHLPSLYPPFPNSSFSSTSHFYHLHILVIFIDFLLETPSDFRSFKLFFPIYLWILPSPSLEINVCDHFGSLLFLFRSASSVQDAKFLFAQFHFADYFKNPYFPWVTRLAITYVHL